ncbi:MAG: trypsin-like serine protease [Deltaproteobacteria bacterium]|nr:trypsin-like serine protease [Deltaproteobacteria bacterium]
MTNAPRASHSLRRSLLLALCALPALLSAPACVADLDVADASLGGVDVGDEKAIIGGANTAIEQHPWQVSLQQGGSHFCGGAVIARDWVLTAQHCVEGLGAADLTVLAGATQLSRPDAGQSRRVSRIVRYAGYSSPEYGRDVALLRLSTPLSLGDRVSAIALALTSDRAEDAGVVARVSGWGTTSAGGWATPDALKAVDVPVVAFAQAQSIYGGGLTADQLSAGTGGRDSCQGDSGGPLTAPSARGRVLIGVVSWGYGCGDAEYPGLYARVSSYAAWIAEQTGISASAGASSPPPSSPAAAGVLLDRDLQGDAGSFQHFAVTVPAGAAVLEVIMSGRRGDADLYVRAGRRPTANLWDCRPYLNTSDEVCMLANPVAGTWYVSVAGYEAFSGALVTAVIR